MRSMDRGGQAAARPAPEKGDEEEDIKWVMTNWLDMGHGMEKAKGLIGEMFPDIREWCEDWYKNELANKEGKRQRLL